MKLTDRIEYSAASTNHIIHIVVTGDTSQNPAGSSYFIQLGKILDLIPPTPTGDTSGNTSHWSASTGTNAIVLNYSESVANGLLSIGEGFQTTTIGDYSHASGLGTIAIGEASFSEGQNTTAFGDISHSEGFETIASGTSSHAEGRETIALGESSHAEGRQSMASGSSAHAEGRSTTSIGNFSHSEGQNTTSIGIASHAEGSGTTANGIASHAGGINTIASGNTSFVHGSGSTAGGTGTVVLGNGITGLTDNTVYVSNLNINNITSGDTLTALAIDTNGNVKQTLTTYFINLRINQVGVTVPTFISQKNNMGIEDADFVLSKVGVGDYEIKINNLPTPLVDNNTYMYSQTYQGSYITNMYWISSDTIGLTTRKSSTEAASDDVGNVFIKIEKY